MQPISSRATPTYSGCKVDFTRKSFKEIYAKPPKALRMAAETKRPGGHHTEMTMRFPRRWRLLPTNGVRRHGGGRRNVVPHPGFRYPLHGDQLASVPQSSVAIASLETIFQQQEPIWRPAFRHRVPSPPLAAGGLVGLPAVVLLEALTSFVGDAHRRSVNFLDGVQLRRCQRLSGVAGSSRSWRPPTTGSADSSSSASGRWRASPTTR